MAIYKLRVKLISFNILTGLVTTLFDWGMHPHIFSGVEWPIIVKCMTPHPPLDAKKN
jgi:hypothetical protein